VLPALSVLALESPASASVSECQWSGGGDGSTWSDNANWTNYGEGTCTLAADSGGPIANSVIVFPSGTPATLTYDGGAAATTFDSITFDDNYTVDAGSFRMTLTGAVGGPCGVGITLCSEGTSSATFAPALDIGSAQEVAAASGDSLALTGNIDGGSNLTVDDADNDGTVAISADNSAFSGNTFVANGTGSGGGLQLENSNGLGTGAVQVEPDGWLWVGSEGPIDVANSLTLGDGTGGEAWLTADSNATWSGHITIDDTWAYIAAATGHEFDLTGNISGSANELELNGSSLRGHLVFSGQNGALTSDDTVIDTGEVTVVNNSGAESLGTGSVFVTEGATIDGSGTVDGMCNDGVVWPVDNTDSQTPTTLTTTDSVDLNCPPSFAYEVTLNGEAHSLLRGSGGSASIDLDGTNFIVNDESSSTGQSWTIISSPAGVSGEFAEIGQGDSVNSNGRSLRVDYCPTSVVLTDIGSSARAVTPSDGLPAACGGGGGGGGGQTLICPPGAVCQTANTPVGANDAIANEDGITAEGSGGEGTVEAGTYATDPTGPPTFDSNGKYFDVSASQGNTFSQVVITDCDLNGGTSLEWWNPAANGGSGGWQPVVGDPGPLYSAGPPPCLTTTIDSASSPTLAQLTGTVFAVSGGPVPAAAAANGAPEGYWLAGSDGGVFAFGASGYYGSVPGAGVHVNNVVGITPTADRGGYWMAGSDGGVFAFGDAPFHGSVPGVGVHVNNVVGIEATPDGGGYYMAGSDGGVFSFGDATFHGSVPGVGVHVNNIMGLATTADGGGYWLVGADGGVYAFGDAVFHGSVPGAIGHAPATAVVGIAATPDGGGYWLVGADGGVYAFGDAPFAGSVPGAGVHVGNVAGIASSPDGQGYWVTGADGGIYAFGDAAYEGSVPGAGAHVTNIRGIAAR
jgi:hypothetical protein